MGKAPTKKSEKQDPKSHKQHKVEAPKAAAEVAQTPESEHKPLHTEYLETMKSVLKESVDAFKNDMDPEKLGALKSTAHKALKSGSYYLAGIVAVTTILIVAELVSNGRVLANTSIGNVNLGYLHQQDAHQKLLSKIDEFNKTPITFDYNGNEVTFTPEQLGVKFGVDEALSTVPEYRFRDTNPLLLTASVLTERKVPLQYTLDMGKTVGMLDDQLKFSDKRAQNAHLVLQDKDFVIEKEKPGVSIDEDRLLAELKKDIETLSPEPINVQMSEEKPRITASQLEGEKDRLIALLKKPLTLEHEDKKMKLDLSNHLDAVQFSEKTSLKIKGTGIELPIKLKTKETEIDPASPVAISSKVAVFVDGGKLNSFINDNLLKKIEVATSGVTITQDNSGKINIDGKGQDGQSVPRDRLIASIDLAANNGISDVPVPVVVDKAPVNIDDKLKALGINNLIATGHSSYYGSPVNRMFNINHGIERFNGILIKPGEEFSFNNQLGEVDGAHGYKLEHVIKQNKVELEMGGGICQVSTTAYRAALLAGLPITERREHTWKISYYGQTMGTGLDATIYIGGQDLKFVNDTPAAILVQAYTDDSNAYFKFYGTDDGRVTQMDGPYGGGLNWKWYRTIVKNGEKIKETIVSNYKPIPPPDPPKPKEIAQTPAATKPT